MPSKHTILGGTTAVPATNARQQINLQHSNTKTHTHCYYSITDHPTLVHSLNTSHQWSHQYTHTHTYVCVYARKLILILYSIVLLSSDMYWCGVSTRPVSKSLVLIVILTHTQNYIMYRYAMYAHHTYTHIHAHTPG